MVHSIHTRVRRGSRILPNHPAIVLHQGGQCRWARGMTGYLTRAQKPRCERIYCKGQGSAGEDTQLDPCTLGYCLAFTRYDEYEYQICTLNGKTGGRRKAKYCAIMIATYSTSLCASLVAGHLHGPLLYRPARPHLFVHYTCIYIYIYIYITYIYVYIYISGFTLPLKVLSLQVPYVS